MADYFPTFSSTIKRFQGKAADEKGRNVPIHGFSLYTMRLESVPAGLEIIKNNVLIIRGSERVQPAVQWQCALKTLSEHGLSTACVVTVLASGTVLIYGDPSHNTNTRLSTSSLVTPKRWPVPLGRVLLLMREVPIGRRTCVYIMLHCTHTFTPFNLFMYRRVQGSCYHCYNFNLQALNLRVCRSMTRLFDKWIAVLITVGCTINAFRTLLLKCKHLNILRTASFHSFRYLVTSVSLQVSAFVCFN